MNAIDVMRYAQRLSVQVSEQDGDLRLRGKRSAVDRLAPLVKQHKRELVVALGDPNQRGFYDNLCRSGQTKPFECLGCTNLQMTRDRQTDAGRIWFWRCAKGYAVLETGVRGKRVVLAPSDCDDWQPWQPGEGMPPEKKDSE